MRLQTQRGPALSLLLAARPLRALVTAAALAGAAALSGRTGLECLLVAATVLVGQATVGWVGAIADRERDRAAGRDDRPVAAGWVEPGTVGFATACAVLLLVPLSVANGTAAGLAYLAAVLALWLSPLLFSRSALSPLPWAVAFGLYPAFLSYGGLGGGLHGAPPTIAMTVLAALLGVGIHVLGALPDLVGDNQAGLRHLPLRLALRTGASKLLAGATVLTGLVAVGIVVTAFTVGLRQ